MSESASGEADSSTDSSDKGFSCPDCANTFEYRGYLTDHLNDDDTDCVGYPCPTCGKNHYSQKGKRQHHKRQHGESIAGVLTECANCGKEYRERIHRNKKAKVTYCSRECQHEHYTTEDCPIPVFKGKDSPNWRDNEVEVECDTCGKSFKRRELDVENSIKTYCSMGCKHEGLSERYAGEKSYHWKGGYEYYGPNWDEIASQVRERDDHTCQGCGKPQSEFGKALNVHHIIPLREFDSYEEANETNNLVSLCDGCHREWEGLPIRPTAL